MREFIPPKGRPRVFVERCDYSHGMFIDLVWQRDDGYFTVIKDITVEDIKDHSYIASEDRGNLYRSSLQGGRELLQAFMDAAFEFGIRPTGIDDLKEELAATKRHLEDLRSLLALGAHDHMEVRSKR